MQATDGPLSILDCEASVGDMGQIGRVWRSMESQCMVHIDSLRCTGCGYCVDACQHGAITIESNVACIRQELCIECGSCAEVCPTGAIRELAPACSNTVKGGETMAYGYGRRFAFRGASLAWPYIGRGQGGLPRCWHPSLWGRVADPALAPRRAGATRQEELGFLRDQADAMKEQLEDLESRIKELEHTD